MKRTATVVELKARLSQHLRLVKAGHEVVITERNVPVALRHLLQHVDTVAPSDEVRRRAARLLAVHPLRAADALQLAAALPWSEEQPHGESLVSLDTRLRDAAAREGFTLVPPEL